MDVSPEELGMPPGLPNGPYYWSALNLESNTHVFGTMRVVGGLARIESYSTNAPLDSAAEFKDFSCAPVARYRRLWRDGFVADETCLLVAIGTRGNLTVDVPVKFSPHWLWFEKCEAKRFLVNCCRAALHRMNPELELRSYTWQASVAPPSVPFP